MKSFLAKFGSLVSFVLSGFDRLRFRGESRRLNNAKGLDSFLYQHEIRYVDFTQYVERLTGRLKAGTVAAAADEGVPIKHLGSPRIDKEQTALELAREHGRTSGRVAVVSAVENCRTYRIRKQPNGWIKPVRETGRCVHYYHYFLHEQLGLCYVRVQTWFPFCIRVGMNGREWAARQLEREGVGFQKLGNVFAWIENPEFAQQLFDAQRRVDWPTLLDDLVRPVHPLWSDLCRWGVPYYWMTEQSEWATDVAFHVPDTLASCYRKWLRHGIDTLSCHDVMRYLGRKQPQQCAGEVKIDLRERMEGQRLKFWYETNSLKMYDKLEHVLRIETTVNQPGGFRVFRTKEGEPSDAPKTWQTMRKGVADLDRRAEVSDSANNRLAESLATVDETRTLGELLRPLGQPVIENGKRRARAINPLTGADGDLLRTLADGNFLLQGFRNRDLRQALHGDTDDEAQRKKQSAAITRKLALLRAHKLIVKVRNTHRYHLSAEGKRIATTLLTAHASNANRFLTCA